MSILRQIGIDGHNNGREALQVTCKGAGAPLEEVLRSLAAAGDLEATKALSVNANGQRPANILVVISEAKEGQNVCRILAEAGLAAIFVSTLHEARRGLLYRPIRLVICAAQLTDGTFRELLSLTSKVPAGMVILCSGGCSTGRRIDILEMGILDYVSPPIRREELIWVIRGGLLKRVSVTRSPRPVLQTRSEIKVLGLLRERMTRVNLGGVRWKKAAQGPGDLKHSWLPRRN